MKSKLLLTAMIVALLVAGCGKTAPTNTTQQPKEAMDYHHKRFKAQ
jgi:phage FluMu protein Com